MTDRLGWKSWATGALALAVVTACGGGGTDSSRPGSSPGISSPTTSSTPARSTSAPPVSPSEAAAADATTVVRRYFAVTDEIGQHPSSSLRALATVATSTQLRADRALLRVQHQRGERQVGDTRVARLTVQAVNLDGTDPAAGEVPTVLVDVCWDVSKVDVVDSHGRSVVSPHRPDTGWTRYTVANYHFAAHPRDGWRVADGQDLKRAPCAAS